MGCNSEFALVYSYEWYIQGLISVVEILLEVRCTDAQKCMAVHCVLVVSAQQIPLTERNGFASKNILLRIKNISYSFHPTPICMQFNCPFTVEKLLLVNVVF
jgi:hypothetical protein